MSPRAMGEFVVRAADAFGFEQLPSRLQLSGRRDRELHNFAAPWDRFVRRIRQFELDLVRARVQSDEDHRFTAGDRTTVDKDRQRRVRSSRRLESRRRNERRHFG